MKRHEAREEAFKILFALDINEIEINIDNDDPYLENVTRGVIENLENIDLLISTNLENWSLERRSEERRVGKEGRYRLGGKDGKKRKTAGAKEEDSRGARYDRMTE